ncbi:hypothetical protein JCM6882_002336, partial [Rhodosporidiobolus microsporus]
WAFGAAPLNFKYSTALAIWLWSSTGVDVLISLALACTLRSRIAGFNSRTDGLLKRLIVVALQTAAYTAVISLVGAAVATAFENAHDYHTSAAGFAFWLPLPALHAISLYTTLSSRRVIAAELGGPVDLTAKPNLCPDKPLSPLSPAFPSTSRATIRLGPLGRLVRSAGGGSGGRDGEKAEDAHGIRSSPEFAKGWKHGGGAAPLPLVVQVQKEEQVEYDDYRDFDDDLVDASKRGRKTREASVDVV